MPDSRRSAAGSSKPTHPQRIPPRHGCGSHGRSLGVLLYELLTGHRPYRLKTDSAQELASVVCEQEPEKPSTAVSRVDEIRGPGGTSRKITAEVVSATREGSPEQLRRRLRGDLDNIILKARQKDPLRRYASVEQFAEDIGRHLNGLPVIARKDTPGYRAGKFVRRHKAGVAAASLVGLSLIGAIIGTTWQARVAATQRTRAERRFRDVRKLANSVVFELHDAIENLPGATAARELLVRRALEYLDSLAAESAGDLTLQRELATAYERVASVQGQPFRPNLGNSQGALENLQKAVAIREGILAADLENRVARREVATVYGRLCELVVFLERKGPEYCRKALAIRQQLVAANPADAQARLELATGYDQASGDLSSSGDLQGALEYQRRALTIFKELAETDTDSQMAKQNLARAYKHVGGTPVAHLWRS
jgi:eukaryotic-like serine/threonine-protein kinase